MNATDLNKEIEAIRKFGDKASKRKKSAIESLFKAGITDKDGNLTENYK